MSGSSTRSAETAATASTARARRIPRQRSPGREAACSKAACPTGCPGIFVYTRTSPSQYTHTFTLKICLYIYLCVCVCIYMRVAVYLSLWIRNWPPCLPASLSTSPHFQKPVTNAVLRLEPMPFLLFAISFYLSFYLSFYFSIPPPLSLSIYTHLYR
jgi:hypothetical protein